MEVSVAYLACPAIALGADRTLDLTRGALHLLGCRELSQFLQPKVKDMRGHGCKLPRLLRKAV